MRIRALATVAAVAASFLTGCASTVAGQPSAAPKASFPPSTTPGSSGTVGGRSGPQIMTATFAAMTTATAFRIKAEGSADDGSKLSLDIHFGLRSAAGSIEQSSFTIQVIVVSGGAYFKGDQAFWRNVIPASEQSVALPLMDGKWVTGPLSDPDFGGIAGSFNRSSFVGSLTGGHPPSAFAVIGTGTHSGVSVTRIKDTTDGSEIDVAAKGTPYPVYSVTPVSSDGGGTVEFSDWNVPFTAQAPPKSEIFDATPYLH